MNNGLFGWLLRVSVLAILVLPCGSVADTVEPTISVLANQRYPWNGLVDITFTITGESGMKYRTSFTARDLVGGTNLTMKTIYDRDGGELALTNRLEAGCYRWVWNATKDLSSLDEKDVTFSGYLTTGSQVIFKNVQLTEIQEFSAVLNGTYISVPQRVKGTWIKTDGNGKEVQFVMADDKYTKCVCTHFEQSGNDVVGYVKWARFVSGTDSANEDFNTLSATTQPIATSATSNGYGVCDLMAHVQRIGTSHDFASSRVVIQGSCEPVRCYVQFHANGGTGTMGNELVYVGTEMYLPTNTFTRSGYAFWGWSLSTVNVRAFTDGQKVDKLSFVDGDTIDLYAIWTKPELADGLDCDDLPWCTGTENEWIRITHQSHDGSDSVKNTGSGGGVANSWMDTTIQGPATISFWYAKVHYDSTITIMRDSTTIFTDTEGTNGSLSAWSLKTFSIPNGVHVIRFNYRHSGTGWAGVGNGCRIDQFTVTY